MGGQARLGAVQGQAEILVFEFDQQLTFFHVLVVVDQHLFDARRQLAGDTRDFALYIGVVGALDEASMKYQRPRSARATRLTMTRKMLRRRCNCAGMGKRALAR